ncbi:ATP/GTP-binding protein [Streptomyces sp. NBC_00827]|uniref:ATP/GTP-binding protein n=1 Tax=Streptomyces sp. NBC_00827 TaxID=2903677 RepID=UPI0038670D3E|nr:ATP/GTP-binding protein [Streptomyces sp. NBC_00827]
MDCPPDRLDCEITAEDPGEAGDSTTGDSGSPGSESGGEERVCAISGETVPCSLPGMGTLNSADGCYWMLQDPQPDAETARLATGIPDDWEPGDEGKFYNVTCPGDPLQGGLTYSATDPTVAAVDPAQLALEAVKKMTLLGPDIASPRAAGKYTVGVPMWMWVNQSATTYGPNTASATAGGVTVTATAKVSKVVWRMGDGASVTCNGPGSPYQASAGMAQSPTCGHMYSKTSSGAQNDKYQVSATSTWTIDWQGGGAAGQLTEIRQTDVQVALGELQVVR